MNYIFRKGELKDIDSFYELIQERIKWMDEVGINQWNKTNYNDRYPLSYYKDNIDYLYVLLDNDKVIAGAYLYREDDRWPKDNETAYYIHHFATSLVYKGEGKIFLKEVEKLAKENNIKYIRLDSAIDNAKLEDYYTSLGYKEVGECKDGVYLGIRREKAI